MQTNRLPRCRRPHFTLIRANHCHPARLTFLRSRTVAFSSTEAIMAYIFPSAATLERKPKVGTTDCVALVQYYAAVPHHNAWRAGTNVMDNRNLTPGTAIATFVNGRYRSLKKGNHTAFFLRFAGPGEGFWVMDQWKDGGGRSSKPFISARQIRPKKDAQNADGSWKQASDDARAFSVIE